MEGQYEVRCISVDQGCSGVCCQLRRYGLFVPWPDFRRGRGRLAAMHKGLFLGRLSYGALAGALVRVGESIRRSSVGIGKINEVHVYSDLAALCVPAFLLV